MKIIIAAGSYWPNKDGIQMVTQYQAEGLVKLGHDVTVITVRQENAPKEELYHGVYIVRFKCQMILKYKYGEKEEFRKYLLEHCDKADAYMAVCAQYIPFIWVRDLLDQIPCRKVLFMHGMREAQINIKKLHDIRHMWKELLLTPYWNLFFKRNWKLIRKFDACCHLFQNDVSYSYFEEHGYLNNFVISNCCEDTLYLPLENTDSIKSRYSVKKPYFIVVANYCSRKNQMEAVRSYYRMKYHTCTLVCIGAGNNDYARRLLRLNEELAVMNPQKEKAHILTGIPREDTVSLIKASYAMLLTSQNEFFPVSIVEGMAACKPYLASNVGNVPMLPGGNVYHDLRELLYWLDYYAEHPEYVKALGKIAGEYARENMYIEDKVRELEKILNPY